MVPPQYLCRKHLLGEHVELHMLVSCINKGFKLDGFIKKRLIETHSIKSRHQALVTEMLTRGYKHNSPLPSFKVEKAGDVNVVDNIRELHNRCSDCRERIGTLFVKGEVT